MRISNQLRWRQEKYVCTRRHYDPSSDRQRGSLEINKFDSGRGVYISGLPYSFENSRLLYRAILWSAHSEQELNHWLSENYNVEVHAYAKDGKYCVVNNTYEPQEAIIFRGDGSSFPANAGSERDQVVRDLIKKALPLSKYLKRRVISITFLFPICAVSRLHRSNIA